jgi:hypothetical protein
VARSCAGAGASALYVPDSRAGGERNVTIWKVEPALTSTLTSSPTYFARGYYRSNRKTSLLEVMSCVKHDLVWEAGLILQPLKCCPANSRNCTSNGVYRGDVDTDQNSSHYALAPDGTCEAAERSSSRAALQIAIKISIRASGADSWRRREGVEPSGNLTAPRLVLKTSGTTGHLPSPRDEVSCLPPI